MSARRSFTLEQPDSRPTKHPRPEFALSGGTTLERVLVKKQLSPLGCYLESSIQIPSGTWILREVGKVTDSPNMHTVQLSESKHLDCSGNIRFTSHSCDPNCRILIDSHNSEIILIAIKDIEPSECLSFDYETTEWVISFGSMAEF
ncbi:hypothetical protein GUITHDRAFT_131886 [Guillardia theta CCMP2712]|uniref:SET domain-containing protein n=1 Tax=Guillardia theta (strain CCMP2712) TaxID=905079 RepID=L1K250_GUITC|nr:hypothetical protein GUITHDRAFT_131886 [Guillardia theta CCMP2712]EKX54901.1 hypothetical protein GUITHDRAFT_131886 [Guillardia theta CCMP2712]|eukprot:XP_005841881.1 hypothetical protein GUITHDRAFT_131886 [Guillardia theta CCMP2712]